MTDTRAVPAGVCHYCTAPATTRDHRVPRALVIDMDAFLQLGRGTPEQYWAARSRNVVPCCRPCNEAKDDKRALCPRRGCLRGWRLLGPEGWENHPTWTPPNAAGLTRTLAESAGPNWLIY